MTPIATPNAIKAFAGLDIEKAVFYPQGDDFLVEREWTCLHHEVPMASG